MHIKRLTYVQASVGLIVAVLLLSLPRPAQARPCVVPQAPVSAIAQLLERSAEPHPPALLQPPNRWKALLPTHLSAGLRGGVTNGDGWYDSAAGLFEHTLISNVQMWHVNFAWDLRPLWASQPTLHLPAEDFAGRMLKVEELARRAATQVAHVRKAQALATQAQEGDYVCQDAQADAEAALLILRALTMRSEPRAGPARESQELQIPMGNAPTTPTSTYDGESFDSNGFSAPP